MRAASLTTASAFALLLAVSSLSAAVALEAPGSGLQTASGGARQGEWAGALPACRCSSWEKAACFEGQGFASEAVDALCAPATHPRAPSAQFWEV
jgi:hypothetical protein